MKSIVFSGIKHCGKSTQARLLARRMNWQLLDSDDLLSELYRQKFGAEFDCSCRGIMKRHGEEFFRQLEAELIRSLEVKPHGEDRVLALGGGVPCNPFLSVAELKKLGYWVYLNADMDIAYERIVRNGVPPFLAGGDPYAKFIRLYQERAPRYAELADYEVEIKENGCADDLGELIYSQLQAEKVIL